MTEEQILRRMERRRIGRVIMYFGLVASAILGILFQSELIADQVPTPVQILGSMAMLITAVICLWGAVTDRWIGEYTGIPLLAAVLALHGISAMLGSGRSLALLAYGLVLVSFSFGLAARWMDVRESKINAETLGASDRSS